MIAEWFATFGGWDWVLAAGLVMVLIFGADVAIAAVRLHRSNVAGEGE